MYVVKNSLFNSPMFQRFIVKIKLYNSIPLKCVQCCSCIVLYFILKTHSRSQLTHYNIDNVSKACVLRDRHWQT